MREIEVKASVANRQAVIDALIQSGAVVSEPVTQHDKVFGIENVDGGGDNTAPWLRVRTETRGEDVTHYLTLKRSITNQLDSIEHETEVADAQAAEAIIRQLNFVPYSDITKTRQQAHLDGVEICIDHIDQLGDFVEAEKLTSMDAGYDEVVVELWMALQSLGVARSDEVTDGYDVLMNKYLSRA